MGVLSTPSINLSKSELCVSDSKTENFFLYRLTCFAIFFLDCCTFFQSLTLALWTEATEANFGWRRLSAPYVFLSQRLLLVKTFWQFLFHFVTASTLPSTLRLGIFYHSRAISWQNSAPRKGLFFYFWGQIILLASYLNVHSRARTILSDFVYCISQLFRLLNIHRAPSYELKVIHKQTIFTICINNELHVVKRHVVRESSFLFLHDNQGWLSTFSHNLDTNLYSGILEISICCEGFKRS